MARKGAKGRRKSREEIVQAPQQFSDITDQVCDQDKKYFEEHPDHDFYVRRCIPGEYWPLIFPRDTWIEVRQIMPGLRMRRPCNLKKYDGIDNKKWDKLRGEGREIIGVFNGIKMKGEVRTR
jgi:hypothetical protein